MKRGLVSSSADRVGRRLARARATASPARGRAAARTSAVGNSRRGHDRLERVGLVQFAPARADRARIRARDGRARARAAASRFCAAPAQGERARSRGRPAAACITPAWCADGGVPERGRHRVVGAAGPRRPLGVLGGQHAELGCAGACSAASSVSSASPGPRAVPPARAARSRSDARGRRSRPPLCTRAAAARRVECTAREPPQQRRLARALDAVAAAARRRRRATGPRGRIRRRKPGDSAACGRQLSRTTARHRYGGARRSRARAPAR